MRTGAETATLSARVSGSTTAAVKSVAKTTRKVPSRFGRQANGDAVLVARPCREPARVDGVDKDDVVAADGAVVLRTRRSVQLPVAATVPLLVTDQRSANRPPESPVVGTLTRVATRFG